MNDLPVVVALVDLDAVEHEAGRSRSAGHRCPARSRADVAHAVEQQAVPVRELRAAEIEAWLVLEMRRAKEPATKVVGPAVDRADDVGRVATALQHDRLPVPADVGDEFDAGRIADQGLRVVAQFECAVVAGIRDDQLVADVAGRPREQQSLLGGKDRRIAVPGDGELRRRAPQMPDGGKTGHRPSFLRVFRSNQPTQPNNPG